MIDIWRRSYVLDAVVMKKCSVADANCWVHYWCLIRLLSGLTTALLTCSDVYYPDWRKLLYIDIFYLSQIKVLLFLWFPLIWGVITVSSFALWEVVHVEKVNLMFSVTECGESRYNFWRKPAVTPPWVRPLFDSNWGCWCSYWAKPSVGN